MKTGLKFMLALLLFGNFTNAQTIKCPDSTAFKLATIWIEGGTRLWGLLLKETSSTIYLNDFNAGPLTIEKNQVHEEDIRLLSGYVLLETVNGTIYQATITGLENGFLKLYTPYLGNFNIQSNTLVKITLAGAFMTRKGNAWFNNPNATRYFFAPSAIPLKKREGYFQNAYLVANSVNVGVTNNLTIGGGVAIPLLFYVTPKISFKAADKLYLGGGVLFTQSFIADFNLSAGIGYGLATFGNYEHNFTLGAGYGFARFNTAYKATPLPIVTLNGMTRIAKKISLVTENWLIPRAGYNKEIISTGINGEPASELAYVPGNFYSAALSFGMRFMPGIRTSVDFSVVGISANPGQNKLVLPYLDFVYKFN